MVPGSQWCSLLRTLCELLSWRNPQHGMHAHLVMNTAASCVQSLHSPRFLFLVQMLLPSLKVPLALPGWPKSLYVTGCWSVCTCAMISNNTIDRPDVNNVSRLFAAICHAKKVECWADWSVRCMLYGDCDWASMCGDMDQLLDHFLHNGPFAWRACGAASLILACHCMTAAASSCVW